MSIPVPCAVLLLVHPSCLKAGVLWPAQAMPLGFCNRLASMQSLLCGDAGIKSYEAASCKCQILSLCPSMHPSIYSCGEGSDLKGRGRDSVVEFRAAESCVGEGCGSGGPPCEPETQKKPVVHLGPQHICPLGLRVGPIEPPKPISFPDGWSGHRGSVLLSVSSCLSLGPGFLVSPYIGDSGATSWPQHWS